MTITEINVKTGEKTSKAWGSKELKRHKDAIKKQEDIKSYSEKRAAEYPPIGDQLDAIMKWLATEGEVTIPSELKSIAMRCMSVKAKHPKPKGNGK